MYVYYTIHILVLVHSIVNSDPGLPIRCPAEQINTSGRISPETKKKVSSWPACAQLCRERVGCRYWTWHHGHTCVTMTDAARLYGNPDAGFIGIPRKIMALKNLKAIIIDLNYIKGILFFLDLTGE